MVMTSPSTTTDSDCAVLAPSFSSIATVDSSSYPTSLSRSVNMSISAVLLLSSVTSVLSSDKFPQAVTDIHIVIESAMVPRSAHNFLYL